MEAPICVQARKGFCRSRRRPLGVTVGLTGQAAGGGCLSPSIVIQNALNLSINCNAPFPLSILGSVGTYFSVLGGGWSCFNAFLF